jgi:hypothetical protein
MFEPASDPSIDEKIRELQSFETCSAFSKAFYPYVAGMLDTGSSDGVLRALLGDLLDATVRYHRRMGSLHARDEVSLADMQSVTDKRRIALESILEQAGRVKPETDGQRAALNLIQAECAFHMRGIDRVVAHLGRAISAGATDPLVYFALGYNRYALAVEAFLEPGETPGEWTTSNVDAFRAACLDAVSAFEQGITGGDMDRQLFWWIAHVLDSAGLEEAAEHTRAQAVQMAGDSRRTGNPGLDEAEEERDHLLPPITEEEVRAVADLLKGTFTAEDIMGGR